MAAANCEARSDCRGILANIGNYDSAAYLSKQITSAPNGAITSHRKWLPDRLDLEKGLEKTVSACTVPNFPSIVAGMCGRPWLFCYPAMLSGPWPEPVCK